MSRGHGRVQQRLAAALERSDEILDTFVLAAIAFDYEPDESGRITVAERHLGSVRRALTKLAAEGLIFDLGRHWPGGRRHWANERIALRFKIRAMRHLNLVDGAAGDLDAVRARAQEMLPMLQRARALGLDID